MSIMMRVPTVLPVFHRGVELVIKSPTVGNEWAGKNEVFGE
jgi:hypothetical protein